MSQRWENAIAGGWQFSGIVTYRSGVPIGTIGTTSCNISAVNAGGCFATYNPAYSGPVCINGGWGSGNLLGSNPATFLAASNGRGSELPVTEPRP